MQYVAFILNLPWTLLGLLLTIISLPYKATFNKRPLVFIFYVKSFWWYTWLPGKKRTRGMANGHVILLSALEEKSDLEHELVHVEQAIREPFIHPFLYQWEVFQHGYRKNKYEDEAYRRAGNVYKGEES